MNNVNTFTNIFSRLPRFGASVNSEEKMLKQAYRATSRYLARDEQIAL